jgi:heterodisulfide reductase subunit A
MYAMKEAMLAKEHEHSIEDITIYYMDIRAYGKGFEDYFNRSMTDEGINYFRGRPARVVEDPISKDLMIRVENTETGESEERKADLVVLASAIVPSSGTAELAEILGVKLDNGGFFRERQSNSSVVESTRPGIFICGCAQGPKDIPDSVAQASAAAAQAEVWVKDDRVSESDIELEPEPEPVSVSTEVVDQETPTDEPRVGVFVCHCGSNIAGVVDVESVAEYAKTLPNVVYANHNLYTCSDNTQKIIQDIIKEENLNRVVVTACTPRTHEPIFRETCAKAGLNPYLFEMGNIREQCSWIHNQEKDEATRKAKDLVRSAVARASVLQPLVTEELPVEKNAFVVGGGISGLSAALDLNNLGFKVYLVEKEPFLGGGLADRELLAPEYTPVTEVLYQNYRDIENSDITIIRNADIKDIKGFIGNFEIDIAQKGLGVDPEKCNSCGDCEKVCPITVEVKYNETLRPRKAIWHKVNGYPEAYAIDFEHCNECGECVKVCKQNCIDLGDKNKITDHHLDVSTITLTIGSSLYEPKEGEFGYKKFPNVITNAELEKLLQERKEGESLKLNGKDLHKIAMVHCIGSRDSDPNGFTGCSRYCCQVALKQTNELRDLGVEVADYYRDIRAFSKGAEKMYLDTRLKGVLYFRYTPDNMPEVFEKDGKIRIKARDLLYGQIVELAFDAVVLSVGMRPKEPDTTKLQEMLRIPRGADGFYLEKHPKLGPVETNTDGIYIAGCAQYPKDVADSISQASATAAKAAIPMSMGRAKPEGIPSVVIREKCTGCGTCEIVCPFSAIKKDEEGKAVVIPALCKGCGTCRASCPEKAIIAPHFTIEQLTAQVDALLKEVV